MKRMNMTRKVGLCTLGLGRRYQYRTDISACGCRYLRRQAVLDGTSKPPLVAKAQ
jgi:hypothetical protein